MTGNSLTVRGEVCRNMVNSYKSTFNKKWRALRSHRRGRWFDKKGIHEKTDWGYL